MAEPPDQMPTAAAGNGHLRASHADREQVIGTLKAAFVRGMLAKDEFGLRVSQALASRTYGELAALTADLPAGLTVATPPQPVQAPGEPRVPWPGRVLAVATVVYAAVWSVAFVVPTNSEGEPQGVLWLVPWTTLLYLFLLLMIGTPILADWLNKRW
jgi:Domain of unknown function (DUF1707)